MKSYLIFAYEHGTNCESLDENPYKDDCPEYKEFIRGFVDANRDVEQEEFLDS